MHQRLRDYVAEALECLREKDGRLVSSGENIRRRDLLMNHIIDEFPVDPDDIDCTRRELHDELSELLKQVWYEDNPVDAFGNQYDSVITDLNNRPEHRYTIAFPLNIDDSPYDTFRIMGEEFQQMEQANWENEFWHPAAGEDSFQKVYTQIPNTKEPWQSFWSISLPASSQQYAVEYTIQLLEIVLGQLQYALYDWTNRTVRSGFSPRQYAWSELRRPFIYLVYRDGDYRETYYDEDLRKREKISISMSSRLENRVDWYYSQIPDFDDPNEVERDILSAFSGYHKAVTEPDESLAFLHYWRTLEALLLTDDGDPTATVPQRGLAITPLHKRDCYKGLLNDQTGRLVKLRNTLSHEPTQTDVTREDLYFLRAIFTRAVPFMIINRKWEKEKIIFWMEQAGSANIERLIDSRRDTLTKKDRELELLTSIKKSQEQDL